MPELFYIILYFNNIDDYSYHSYYHYYIIIKFIRNITFTNIIIIISIGNPLDSVLEIIDVFEISFSN